MAIGMIAGMAAAGGGAQLIGAIAGRIAQARSERERRRLMNEAMAELERIPELDPSQLVLELDRLGSVEPWMVETYEPVFQEASRLSGFQEDAQFQDAGRKALERLSQFSRGQVTDADKAALRDVQFEVGRDAAARDAALTQQAAQRGVAGSGIDQTRRAIAGQEAANRAASAGRQLLSDVQQRALQSIAQQGSLARGLESDRFQRASGIAAAEDRINATNTGYANQARRDNTMAQNMANRDAALENYGRDRVNLGQSNMEKTSERDAYLSQYEDRWRRADSKNQIRFGKAGLEKEIGQNKANFYGGLGAGVGNVFQGAAQHQADMDMEFMKKYGRPRDGKK